MSMRPDGHSLDATADNVRVFHGREVRSVPWPPGGGGWRSTSASLASRAPDDPEGWTGERRWTSTPGGSQTGSAGGETGRSSSRKGSRRSASDSDPRRSPCTTGAHLHVDDADEFWLSAEDGCEGVAQKARPRERDFGAAARSLFR